MRSYGILLALAGCGFSVPPGSGAPMDDARLPDIQIVDVPVDDCTAWTAKHFDACMIPMPSGDLTLDTASPYTFDTSTNTLTDSSGTMIPIAAGNYTQAGGAVATVWSITNFQIGQNIDLIVIGNKPLIVAAWGAMNVAGWIDAGSYRGVRNGAGANPVRCAAHAAAAGLDGTSGTGGGGGGGNNGNGAAGGDGDGNCGGTTCYRTGGARGASIPAPAIVFGGCGGAASGKSSGVGAEGGSGGGAVMLVARGALVVSGSVRAGGAGGGGDVHAGGYSYGGGGGGAGGFIGLEGQPIDASGSTLVANGGGGGGGANIAGTGGLGEDARSDGSAAAGGAGGPGGTGGGVGSSIASLDGGASNNGTPPGTPPDGGGGGGGGGAGFVLYWTTTFTSNGATISPPAQQGP